MTDDTDDTDDLETALDELAEPDFSDTLALAVRRAQAQERARWRKAIKRLIKALVTYENSDHPAGAYQCAVCKGYGGVAETVQHTKMCALADLAQAMKGVRK